MDGLILAGGESRRMGGLHKGSLTVEGQTFAERIFREFQKETQRVMVSCAGRLPEGYSGMEPVRDRYPGCGPVAGIHAGLLCCRTEWMMVAPCDMPFLTIGLYRLLKEGAGQESDGAVPVFRGRVQPLCALYHRRAAAVLERQLESGNYRLKDALKLLRIRYVDVTGKEEYGKMFENINTTEEYERMKENSRSMPEAVELLAGNVRPVEETETVTLPEAQGRVLAASVTAESDQPPFPRSPLDGYALRSGDSKGATKASPVSLRVKGEVLAGMAADVLVEPGTAVRIMTGAPLPKGADCVIRQEDTDYGEETVQIYRELGTYENYCFAGEDYRRGEAVLGEGSVLGAAQAGILAGMGIVTVPVYRRLRAAVLTTGDELVLPGEPRGAGKIYDSNLSMLRTGLLSWGIQVVESAWAGDDVSLVRKKLDQMAEKADILITTGGVSVGKKDIMHEVTAAPECERLFWKIAVKPGMPTLAALWRGRPLLCLSGNPYGALVGLELLVRPVAAVMARRKDLVPLRVSAVLKNRFPKKSRVTRYVRACYRDGEVQIAEGSNDSGVLSTMEGCNCLLEIPAGMECLEEGAQVWVVLI